MHIAILCISAVAICTERVEAKLLKIHESAAGRERCNLHGACGGKAPQFVQLRYFLVVAICTERVEAKDENKNVLVDTHVAICTERVEAKFPA